MAGQNGVEIGVLSYVAELSATVFYTTRQHSVDEWLGAA